MCVLQQKGYRILEFDQWGGYDIRATYPGGVYDYYIEVKCGPKARLSPFQKGFRNVTNWARGGELGIPVKYVVCQFDDYMRLMGGMRSVKKLLRGLRMKNLYAQGSVKRGESMPSQ